MKRLNILDAFQLPVLPNYLLFNNGKMCFDIDQLKDAEIKELYTRMAKATIARKRKRAKQP